MKTKREERVCGRVWEKQDKRNRWKCLNCNVMMFCQQLTSLSGFLRVRSNTATASFLSMSERLVGFIWCMAEHIKSWICVWKKIGLFHIASRDVWTVITCRPLEQKEGFNKLGSRRLVDGHWHAHMVAFPVPRVMTVCLRGNVAWLWRKKGDHL